MSVIVVGHPLCDKSSFIRSVSGKDAVTRGVVTRVTNELSLAEVSSEVDTHMFTSWTDGKITDRMLAGWLTLPMNRRSIAGVIVLYDNTKPETAVYACGIIQQLTRDVYNPTPFVLKDVSCSCVTLDWVMEKLRK